MTIVARNNSILGLLQAMKSGLGLSALPMPMAEQHDELVRLFGLLQSLAGAGTYLLTPISAARSGYRCSSTTSSSTEKRSLTG
jgi:DNA-binding transcriptional LysR family regulator